MKNVRFREAKFRQNFPGEQAPGPLSVLYRDIYFKDC